MMDICFVTPELSPYAKVGGLADVSSALPAALSRAGQNVMVVMPCFRDLKVDPADIRPVPELTDADFMLGDRDLQFDGLETTFPGFEFGQGPRLILLKCDALYDRDGVYTNDADEFLRFLFLSTASLHVCQRLAFKPDVIHCNDWQTALIPLLLKSAYAWDQLFQDTSTVLTIHNIGHQGQFSSSILPYLALKERQQLLHQEDLKDGRINFLKTGLMYADALTAVSPTYARQIQTGEYGMGLQDILKARSESLHGILNGIDSQEWNPESDPLIPHHFSVDDLEGKKKNKAVLLEKMGVDTNVDSPAIGIVSRLASQKGFELLFDVMDSFLESQDLRFLVLGSGEQKYVDYFTGLRHRFPDKVGFYHGFDNSLAHLIEAGCDMFLMPSQYEPCGLNQMYSQVYGTAPIVRKTGGLADTVEHFQVSTGKGTGFVFEHFTSEGVRWAIDTALEVYRRPDAWNQLIQNAMSRDFSWGVKAEEYLKLYESINKSSSAVARN